jgi:periplasmic protein TonB
MFNRAARSSSKITVSTLANNGTQTSSHSTAQRPYAWQRLIQAMRNTYFKLGKTDLQRMLVMSATIHAVVLIVRFAPDELAKHWEKESLQVVLVNSAGDEAPSDAQALANANLRGGGEADEGLVKSPLPNLDAVEDGESLESLQKQVKNLEAVQSSLLSALKGKADTTAVSGTSQQYNPEQGQTTDNAETQLKRKIAAVDKEVQDYNKRPKRVQISPATREAAFATYYALWSDHTERLGTDYYPEAARGKHAEIVVTVSVHSNGSLDALVVERSSGNRAIDSDALRLLRRLAPYPRFKGHLQGKADILDITTKLVFTPANILTAEMHTGVP